MHGAQRWLERDRDARVPMTPTTLASATWAAPPPIAPLVARSTTSRIGMARSRASAQSGQINC
jgi:hypothetical protein